MSTYPIVQTPTQVPALVNVRNLDVRSALVRGLAEHFRRVTWNYGQRAYKFEVVEEFLSDFAGAAQFPAACCFPTGVGAYDEAGGLGNNVEDFGTWALLYWGDFQGEFNLECWFTSEKNRQAAIMSLEDACVPVEWMRGFRIVLSDYFNAVGEYAVINSNIEDVADDRTKGWYKVTFSFRGSAPLYRSIELPRLDPVAVTETGVSA